MCRGQQLIPVGLIGFLLLGGFWIFDTKREQGEARAALGAAEARAASARARAGQLAEEVAQLREKLRDSEADNAALLGSIDKMGTRTPATTPSPVARITEKEVDARYARARELAWAGKDAEALAEFLWCYDEGMVAVSRFSGVRGSFLLNEIARLGQSYPPALDALRLRRDALGQAISSDAEAADGLADYASLNHYLKEDEKSVALFDRLPSGDERRARLGLAVYGTLAKAGRYADALEAHPYERMTSLFDAVSDAPKLAGFSEAKQAEHDQRNRLHAVKMAAGNIEVLAGAGELDAARAYAAKLLGYDDTDATRRLLRDVAARAGHPKLFDPQ